MSIVSIQTTQPGLVGVIPTIAYIQTTDTVAQVLATGYLNAAVQSQLASFTLPCMCCVSTVESAGAEAQPGWYALSHSSANWSLTSISSPGEVTLPTVANAMAVFSDVSGTLTDNIAATNTVANASATPGTVRSIKGVMSSTITTQTSGNLVGVRGEVDYVGASGGFLYGVQGKIIPTGTLSGSSWNAAVFAQLDWHSAVINAGQVACVWADMGATSGTATDVTGLRMFAGTNTTAATAFSMMYLYGKATNLLELSGSSSTYISTGAATPGGDLKKIAISIDGVTHYILAAATWS